MRWAGLATKGLLIFSMQAERGFSIVEVLLAASLFGIVVTSLAGALFFGQDGARTAGERSRAVMLAEEALEAARNIRDASPTDPFVNLTTGTHGLATAGGVWTLSGSSDVTDIFTRTLAIANVDDNTRQVTGTVTWDQTPQRSESVSLVSYLTAWVQEVATVFGAWDTATNRAGCYNASGNSDGLRVAISGTHAFVVRDGGNPDFLSLNITSPSTPTLADSLALSGSPQDVFVSGDYAYVASTGTELLVIDISDPTDISEVGSLNLSGGDDAVAVYAVGTTVYLTRADDNLYVIDASTASSPSESGSIDVGSTGNDIFVLDNNGYYVSSDNNPEVSIIDITSPGSMTVDASINLSGNSNALAVDGFTDTLLIGRADGSLHIYDISTPTSPSELSSSYDQGSQINNMALNGNNEYLFLATNEDSAELQVVDITNTSSPSLHGSYNEPDNNDLLGVAYDETNDQVVIASGSDSQEACVVVPYSSGDWGTPLLAGTLNLSGNDDGWKVGVSGDYAYVVRRGGSPEFVVIDISDTSSISQETTLSLDGAPENVWVSGNYAYVASDSNSQELQVIDISTPTSPSQVGNYNASGNRDAWGVYVSGTTAYLVRDGNGGTNEFQIVDVTTPASPSGLGSLDLAADGNEVYVSGNYAYVASDHNSRELQVVDVSNTASPSIADTLNLSGNTNAETVTGFGDYVFVGQGSTVHVVDVSTPTSVSVSTTYSADGTVRDLTVGSSNTLLFVANDGNDSELDIVDVTTPTSPTQKSLINLDGNLNGVAYESGDDFAVGVGDDDSDEVVVVTP